MKWIFILLIPAMIFSSCKKDVSKFNVYVYVQTNTVHDRITVALDGQAVLDATLSSRIIYGGGNGNEGGEAPLTTGSHSITVTANSSVIKTETFQVTKDRFIYILFNRPTGEISLKYYDEPLLQPD